MSMKYSTAVNTCAYIKFTGGGTCMNKTVEGSDFCHLIGHNAEANETNAVELERRKAFMNAYYERTLDMKDYHLEDVLGDDACLFRSLALGLLINIENVKFSDILMKCVKHHDSVIDEGSIHISDETRIAKYLQEISRRWLITNRKREVDICGGEKVEDIVLNTHELKSMKHYSELYSVFAGELNTIYSSKKKKHIKIEPRWGGFPEEIALADMFEVDISIYVPRKVNHTFESILPSFGLKEGTRFEIYTEVLFEGDRKGKDIPKIELLLIDKTRVPHYNLMISNEFIANRIGCDADDI